MGNLILPQTYILGNGEKSMKIEKMTIDNINGIKHLDLTFNKGLNLICGENGVGKTTILRSIAHKFLYGNDNFIKKRYGTEKGNSKIYLYDNTSPIIYEIKSFLPSSTFNGLSVDKEQTHCILYFSPSRTIDYFKLNALPSVETIEKDSLHSSKQLIHGVDKDIKSWFVNRLIFSNIKDSLNDTQINNLNLSKNIFCLLDNNLSVKTAKPDFEIVLNQNQNEIYFEMLSDGYKSCIFILLGIIKEVEYRFPKKNAIDFDGIIMIDEIDIHLHPQWQAKLVKVLKETFPNAQIIATTHSPSVLQNATVEEIIPLYKDENGDVHIKELHLGEYGLQGWTLEEIMKDVMGMESTTSNLYARTIKEFDAAMYDENVPLIKEKYETLCKMLHPKSTLRQLLKIQMAGLEE